MRLVNKVIKAEFEASHKDLKSKRTKEIEREIEREGGAFATKMLSQSSAHKCKSLRIIHIYFGLSDGWGVLFGLDVIESAYNYLDRGKAMPK